jgi:hypothetical protein
VGAEVKAKWELAYEIIDPPRFGQVALKKLTVRLHQMPTGQVETFKFEKFSHHFINWSEKTHIQDIMKWRNVIFRGSGIVIKRSPKTYHPEEEEWLLLCYKKIKTMVEAGNNI